MTWWDHPIGGHPRPHAPNLWIGDSFGGATYLPR